jgi:hypothetical protein
LATPEELNDSASGYFAEAFLDGGDVQVSASQPSEGQAKPQINP